MINKHYDSISTDAACKMAMCDDCMLFYLMELCPFNTGTHARIILDMNMEEVDSHA